MRVSLRTLVSLAVLLGAPLAAGVRPARAADAPAPAQKAQWVKAYVAAELAKAKARQPNDRPDPTALRRAELTLELTRSAYQKLKEPVPPSRTPGIRDEVLVGVDLVNNDADPPIVVAARPGGEREAVAAAEKAVRDVGVAMKARQAAELKAYARADALADQIVAMAAKPPGAPADFAKRVDDAAQAVVDLVAGTRFEHAGELDAAPPREWLPAPWVVLDVRTAAHVQQRFNDEAVKRWLDDKKPGKKPTAAAAKGEALGELADVTSDRAVFNIVTRKDGPSATPVGNAAFVLRNPLKVGGRELPERAELRHDGPQWKFRAPAPAAARAP